MSELVVEPMFVKFNEIETLHKVLDKVSIDGLDDAIITEVLIAIALISEANETLEKKIKAINEKMPDIIKDYNKNPDVEHSEKEMSLINRHFANWQEQYYKAKDVLLEIDSNIEIKDIKVLSKEQVVAWIKANKKEIKANDCAILYKVMLKK